MSSDAELKAAFQAISERKKAEEDRIVKHCRSLVSTLKDRGSVAAAEELAALYFQLDAVEGELAAFVMKDPLRLFDIMLRARGGCA
jgi:hypothetical protein